jgi:hypothetical protein
MKGSPKERFDAKWQEDPVTGCWIWVASFRAQYGCFGYKNKIRPAHRVSYELYVGEIEDSKFVCHRCDNPSCVNPKHLFLGTHLDNMRDRTIKNRASGGGSGGRRLCIDTAREIRRYFIDTHNISKVARNFNITRRTVRAIINNEHWRE